MNAGFFCPLKVVIGAVAEPTPGVLCVVETDGTNCPCWVAFATRFRARGVLAQQAACRLFVEEKFVVFHGAKIKKNKIASKTASKTASKEIELEKIAKMPIDDARKALKSIKGVGPKVAECVLLFGMYRTEAFPVDVWIKRVLAQYYPGGFPAFAQQNAGIAQQYLFHYIRSIS